MQFRYWNPETGEHQTVHGIQTRLPSGFDRSSLRRYIKGNGVCGILMDLAYVMRELSVEGKDRIDSGDYSLDKDFYRDWYEMQLRISRDLDHIREYAERVFTPARPPEGEDE